MSSAIETNKSAPEFGKVRAALWPIHGHEMRKFLPMGLMMFFILYDYTILRSLKDTIILPYGGSAITPFIKFFIVMPAAILFVILYSKLVNVFKRETVFYLLAGIFVGYFALYGFVLYPNNALLLPDNEHIKALQLANPYFRHVIAMYGAWTDVMFYTFSELWGSIMLSLLFWQFANEITRTREAKRFYALFGLLANVALLVSGGVLKWSAAVQEAAGGGQEVFIHSLVFTLGSVLVGGLLVIYLYSWMQSNVLTDPRYYDAAEKAAGPKKAKGPKLSVMESFKYLLTSKYIGYIALLVLAYGISMNLIEVGWKEIVRLQYPEKAALQDFYGNLQLATGFATIVAILFFKEIVSRFGWFVGAIFTPIIMALTGAIFFMFVLFGDFMSPVAAFFGITSLLMAVIVGTLQNVLSKGTKYSLFDPTKEMAYIPLDQELKTKGKAAVDVIGGRLGKAGGGLITLAMVTMTAAESVVPLMPYLAAIAGVVILLWILAVAGLNRMYQAAVKVEEAEEDQIDKKLGKA